MSTESSNQVETPKPLQILPKVLWGELPLEEGHIVWPSPMYPLAVRKPPIVATSQMPELWDNQGTFNMLHTK